jgi:uncharacterized protein
MHNAINWIYPCMNMIELSSKQVTIDDAFWTARLEVNSSRAIFHQWEQLELSGCIDNFRIVAKQTESFREGWFFADSDGYKWLDAAARIHTTHPDPALTELMDKLISLIESAQDDDGYIFTYNQLHFPGKHWVNLMIEHELYCHGHLIEAGVSHFQATHTNRVLNIARKAADRITADFLGKGAAFTPGHEEVEIAFLRLYQVTGYPPYLEMARQFLEQRGQMSRARFAISQIRQLASLASRISIIRKQRQEYSAKHPGFIPKKLPPNNYAKTPRNSYLSWLFNDLNGKYYQQHTAIRNQIEPVGHSVRFGYLETAIAKLQRITGDQTLLQPMEKTWDRMVTRRMYVTGGIGSVPGLEGFGNDYELDPEYAYAETCAALACMFWDWELALISGEAKYSDLFEWQLYNAAAVGMGIGGTNYLYNNPLTCRGGVTRRDWYSVPCCPSNLSRTWADLGKYIYSFDIDAIWIHQYIGSRTSLQPGTQVDIEIESSLPWGGTSRIKIEPAISTTFTLYLRIPSWASNFDELQDVSINGKIVNSDELYISPVLHPEDSTAQGFDPRASRFLSIKRLWLAGDLIELRLDMPIVIQHTSPKVKGHGGKAAITRGPLVYCLENLDNPGVDIFTTHLDTASLIPELAPELLGGTTIIRGRSAEGLLLTFIPYHLWANRGESHMTVWVNT